MKKSQIVKLVPQAKTLRQDLKKAQKALLTAQKAYNTLEEKVDAIDGVTLYNGFPVRVAADETTIEVHSAADEVTRYASLAQEDETTWEVYGYYEGRDESVSLGIFPRKTALEYAQNFVATGKEKLPQPTAKPSTATASGEAAPKKRGRPRKNPAAA